MMKNKINLEKDKDLEVIVGECLWVKKTIFSYVTIYIDFQLDLEWSLGMLVRDHLG